MECTEVRQKLVEAVEGELPSPEEAAVRQHVAECSDCRSEFERLRRASGALNTVVSQLAPPTRYLTRRRLDRLMFAYSERHRPIKLVTWRRFVAAAAVAAIIAAVPFIVGDVAQILNAPPVPRLVAQQPPPADPVAVVLSLASTAHEGDGRRVRFVPVRSGSGGASPGSIRVVRTDSPGVAVPIRHALYDVDESSRWW